MRVAFDATFAADIASRPGENVAGISRAVLETGRALEHRPRVDLTCVGWSGPDSVVAGASVRRWARSNNLPVDMTATSRLGLGRAYETIAAGMQAPGATRVVSRVALAVLKRTDVKYPGIEQRYDVFHSTFSPLTPRSRRAAAAQVLTVYDLIPMTDPSATTASHVDRMQAILDSVDVSRDVVVAISHHTKRQLCDVLAIPPERVVVAPLAAAAHFRPAALDRTSGWLPARVGAGAPYLLSVASVQPRKNVGLLVKAFARLRQRLPDSDMQLILTGSDGWLGDDVEALLSRDRRTRSCVHRIGFVSDAVLAQLYAGALTFVFPSRSEGFGLPALEAMQSGTPTIVARAGALPEVVGDGALLVEPNDDEELTDALERVCVDETLRQRLAADAVVRARSFSWARCAQATEEAYARALHEVM